MNIVVHGVAIIDDLNSGEFRELILSARYYVIIIINDFQNTEEFQNRAFGYLARGV